LQSLAYLTPCRKAENSLPPIEEYSYDYFATGKVRRPPSIAENEDNIHNIFDVREIVRQARFVIDISVVLS
jgi:hypothetical protein